MLTTKTVYQAIGFQVLAGILFISALFVVHAYVEEGMNDDWSFVRTAQQLAATGSLRYNAWSAPLIGFQAAWGAFFVKVFGFSFFAVRCSSYVLTAFSIPILWQLLRLLDLSCTQAFFGLTVFLFSPLNLPNLATFMTDMPAFMLFTLTLLAALRSWQAVSDSKALMWMSVLVTAGLLSGSVRQIYWLAPVVFLTTLAAVGIRSVKLRLCAVGGILFTIAAAGMASYWLGHQSYVPAETTLRDLLQTSWKDQLPVTGIYLERYFVGAAVLLLPVTCLSLSGAFRRQRLWSLVLIAGCAAAVTSYLAQPLPWLGNTLTQDGILLRHTVSAGERPLLLSSTVILLIGTCGVAVCLHSLFKVRSMKLASPLGRFAALSVPFLLAYIGVLAVRSLSFGLYDRYLIPAVFVLGTLVLAAYARTQHGIPVVGVAMAVLFGLYALATTHDYFAEARAKLQAANEVLAAGHERSEILAGFEYDCWTQTQITGHINNDLVENPPDAYRDADDCNGKEDVQIWWRTLTPDIRARYVLALTPLPSLRASEFKPIEYRRWLPFGPSYVYVQSPQPPDTPLVCKASNGGS